MDTNKLIDGILEWLASLQPSNGAFPMYPMKKPGDASKVCPYFSEFAGLALLLKPEQYGSCVQGYLDWHFAHLNTAATDYNGEDGTIYDYQLTLREDSGVSEEILMDTNTGKPSYDSTDSYAALFLELLWEYGEKTGDRHYVLTHREEMFRICRAMLCTLDNGLTWAKPDYPAKYLMDNCEVWKGLCAAEKLYSLCGVGNGEEVPAVAVPLEEIVRLKGSLAEAIESCFTDPSTDYYYVGVTGVSNGFPETINMNIFYPDALAQLFPVVMGLVLPENPRSRRLYDKFNQYFSCEEVRWEEMRGKALGAYMNGLIPYTAARMHDVNRVRRYLETYRQRFLETAHPYPAFNADCAQVALAADYIREWL